MTYDYKKMKEVEETTNGDVAFIASLMAFLQKAPTKWAMAQIERGIGDVAWAASGMVCCRYKLAPTEWAIKQIERGIGDVALAAYYMARDELVPPEWAIKQIERGIGDVDEAASRMSARGLAPKDWVIVL